MMYSPAHAAQRLLVGARLTTCSFTQGFIILHFSRFGHRENDPQLPFQVTVEVTGNLRLDGSETWEAYRDRVLAPSGLREEALIAAVLVHSAMSGEGAEVTDVKIEGADLIVTLACGVAIRAMPDAANPLSDWTISDPPAGPPSGIATRWRVVSDHGIVTVSAPD